MLFWLLSWWYTTGWIMLTQRLGERVAGILHFFSVGQLAVSLFAPFRQISVGSVQGTLQVKLRAWADRQFSRVIGAIVRSMLIIAGLAAATVVGVLGGILVIIWPFVPLLPLAGFALSVKGWR